MDTLAGNLGAVAQWFLFFVMLGVMIWDRYQKSKANAVELRKAGAEADAQEASAASRLTAAAGDTVDLLRDELTETKRYYETELRKLKNDLQREIESSMAIAKRLADFEVASEKRETELNRTLKESRQELETVRRERDQFRRESAMWRENFTKLYFQIKGANMTPAVQPPDFDETPAISLQSPNGKN